jgi:hypothetical protein
VLAESYFSLHLWSGRCVLASVRFGWVGRNRVVRVDHCMSVVVLTELDKMVFFTPSRNTDQGV